MATIRKTKIICTLGPATDAPGVLRSLMQEGMNAARFNMSHGNYDEVTKRYNEVVDLRNELNLPIATILDTKGPEIRLGKFKNGKIELEDGQQFTLTTRPIEGDETCVSISFPDLINDVEVGTHILIDDGLVELEAIELKETDIVCTVINGGTLSDRKGVNVPNVRISMPYISEKDHADIVFAAKTGFDFIAASFVRTADDIKAIRKILAENDGKRIKIIAKIENREGVENIDRIIEAADAVMVARGDMGVEIPLEEVPVIQKMIIKKVYLAGKQVITATQMLDSMIKHPRPTRAEAADVANAVYDGTSAIMLSGETAAGLYPIEAVQTMVKIAISAEDAIDYNAKMHKTSEFAKKDVTNAISHATCTTAVDLEAAAIITVTESGQTARMISRYRPGCPIVGCATSRKVCRQLNLSWGVNPMLLEEFDDADELLDKAVKVAVKRKIMKKGELAVVTAGVPLGKSGTTNLLKVIVAE